ncbi:hypothetical protein [Pseudomonas prosekii]|uniref:hypothetical protein n=1 Tax=Pseudomonas prosekii TaxID=1148509 RepID=UPI0011EAEA29|nr:hypothetical protein [Pseudomonas prosekii]
MSSQKKKHLRKKGASLTSGPKNSQNLNPPEPVPHPIQHDLKTLLNETPQQSIDVDWENLAPAGREFQ